MTLVKSAPGVSAEAFADNWRNTFLPAFMALEVPKRHLNRVLHHHVLPSNIREDEGLPVSQWAGVASYYFDEEGDAEAVLADPAFKALLDAHKAVIPEATHLIVDELWMYNGEASHLPIKMFAFFKRKPHLTRAFAHQYYRTTHAAVGASINKNRTVRYVQNHVVASYTNPDKAYDYDAGPEIWFKSMDVAMDLFGDTEGMEILGRDEETFVLRNELLHFLTDEQVVFERKS